MGNQRTLVSQLTPPWLEHHPMGWKPNDFQDPRSYTVQITEEGRIEGQEALKHFKGEPRKSFTLITEG